MSARALVEILAIFLMFGLSVLVFQLWWLAAFAGGEITLDIHAYGEMWFEYALWFVLTPIITLGFYFYVTGHRRTDPR